MAEVVTMLALSPTMDEGTLAEWTIGEGESVEEGEILAEVETDKATMEMESFFGGTLLKRLVEVGDSVPVGAPMAVIGQAGEDISAVLDDIGDGAGGQPAEQGGDAESASSDDRAESADHQEAAQPSGRQPSTGEQTASADHTDGRLKASPLARRMADDEGIQLQSIDGSGPSGRIVKRDIDAAVADRGAGRPTAGQAVEAPAAPTSELAGREVPLSQMRKTIASRLQGAWQSTPHFTLTMEIDMAAAMDQRAEINQGLEDAEIDAKISVNDMIVKACAAALEQVPAMNVAFQGDHLLEFDDVHIGVAVAIDEGLITPTIQNAARKGLRHISADIRELARRAQDKKLSPDEYTGATFTVSNLGMFGIDHFMAIINPPQAGILACGAVQEVPVAEDGELSVGTRMKVTLSCDHRAVDGAVGSRFLQHVRRLLETPLLMLV